MDVNRAIKDVAQATYRGAPRIFRDKEAVAKIRESLTRAAREIDEIVDKLDAALAAVLEEKKP